MRIPDPQVVKLIYVRHIFIEAVHLVHHKDDRLVRPAEHVRHLGIGVHQSLLHIHHEQDHIRRINGDLPVLRIWERMMSELSGSMPPVSIRVNIRSSQSHPHRSCPW